MRVDDEALRKALTEFKEVVALCKRPVGHGTSSEYLKSILSLGLGGNLPHHASSPGKIYVTDLQVRGGLVAAYACALREELFWPFRKKHVSLVAAEHGGRGVIHRYVDALGLTGIRALFARTKLALGGAVYCMVRRQKSGRPLLLVYDAKTANLTKKGIPAIAPSERHVAAPISAQYLVAVVVPAATIEQIRKITPGACKIFPLEMFEFEEMCR